MVLSRWYCVYCSRTSADVPSSVLRHSSSMMINIRYLLIYRAGSVHLPTPRGESESNRLMPHRTVSHLR
jgi:hypothetical protein